MCPVIARGCLLTLMLLTTGKFTLAADTQVAVTITEGHETDPVDRGRPVVLVAGALGVKPEQFRQAFSGVTPARNGGPSESEARANKAALMRVLGPLGISNDRLDEVSNYYRYQPQSGRLWTNTPAKAHAIISNGKVTQIVVTDGGSGYCSTPRAAVAGYPDLKLAVKWQVNKDFRKNGSITAIEIVQSKQE